MTNKKSKQNVPEKPKYAPITKVNWDEPNDQLIQVHFIDGSLAKLSYKEVLEELDKQDKRENFPVRIDYSDLLREW